MRSSMRPSKEAVGFAVVLHAAFKGYWTVSSLGIDQLSRSNDCYQGYSVAAADGNHIADGVSNLCIKAVTD